MQAARQCFGCPPQGQNPVRRASAWCTGGVRHGFCALQHSAWFALLEPGNLCLALLQQGHWSRVRSLRIDSAWREELPLILEREAYLADNPSVPHEVYVWDTRPGDTTLPDTDLWQFHPLATGGMDRHFAMTMAG